MNRPKDAFPFPEVAAEVMRMTPAVYAPYCEADDFSGVFAYNRALRANIGIVIAPYLERATSEEEQIWIRADVLQFEDTMRAGLEDIDDIFYIANRVLSDRHVAPVEHEGILRRSSRLVMAASRLDNSRLQELLEVSKTGKSVGDILTDHVQPPMEIQGSKERESLSWSRGLLEWMKLAKTPGCPARTAVIEAEGHKRQTVMQLMWDRAVTAAYGSNGIST